MKTPNQEISPFRYGCVVEGSFYCPRPILEKQLSGFIRSGQNVVVHGERRMGKTSLIKSTVSSMKGWRAVYVDFLNVQTVGDVCRRIVSGVRAYERKASFFEKVLKMLPNLRPVMKVDPVTGEFGFSLDPKSSEDPYAVEDIADMLSRIASGRKVAIVFDEFQDVGRIADGKTVLALLRSRIQFQGEVPYVFTGSVRSRMIDMFDNPDSPFYKSAVSLSVGEIGREDFKSFIEKRFKDGSRRIGSATVERIMSETSNVPGDVQQLCEAIWSVTTDKVEDSDINSGLEVVFMREGEKFENMCSMFSPVQFKFISALARVGGAETQSRKFLDAAAIGNAASSRKAAKRLEALRVIYQFRGEYRFVSQFFRAWILHRGY